MKHFKFKVDFEYEGVSYSSGIISSESLFPLGAAAPSIGTASSLNREVTGLDQVDCLSSYFYELVLRGVRNDFFDASFVMMNKTYVLTCFRFAPDGRYRRFCREASNIVVHFELVEGIVLLANLRSFCTVKYDL